MSELRQRQTFIFFLPLDISAIAGDSPASEGTGWDKRQLYINPQSFVINDRKIINNQLTKGGYVVQYWGEELSTIAMTGSTGSSGIEGINVLKDIYRHEQIQFKKVLEDRQRQIALATAEAQAKARAQVYGANAGGFFAGAADALFGGAYTSLVGGVSNSIDILFGTELGDNYGKERASFQSTPTLASFATNIELYFQGEFFRGYFTSVSVTEQASEPGHFNYNLNYTVTRRMGKRTNFMPWHRNPLSNDGETLMSQKTTESKGSFPGVNRLTFPTSEETWNGNASETFGENVSELAPGRTRSQFVNDSDNQEQKNEVPIRRNSIEG